MSLDSLIAALKDHSLDSAQMDVLRGAMADGVMGPVARNVADLLCNYSALLSVGEAMGKTSSLDAMMDSLGHCLKEIFDVGNVWIHLYDPVQKDLITRDHLGPGIVNERRTATNAGAVGACFTEVRLFDVDDGSIVAPIRKSGDGCIGVIEVSARISGKWQDDDMSRLDLISRQVASGLDHALLASQIAVIRAEELQFLELSASIARERDVEVLLRRVVKASAELLGAERSTLFLHDAQKAELWSRVLDGDTSDLREIRVADTSGIAGAVFATGETLTIDDCYADPRFNKTVDEISGYRTNNMLSAPIEDREGGRIGVIQVLNRRNNHFDIMAEQRLQAFAAHIAVALENARLFSEK